MTLQQEIAALGRQALRGSRALCAQTADQRNAMLKAMADQLEAAGEELQQANAKDLAAGRAAGLSSALLDRLELSDERIRAMAEGVRQIAALQDPLGQTLEQWDRPNGLVITKVRVPIGVVVIVYESRPNVTADAAALCLKSGNAVILRGGKEAMHSNRAIADQLIRAGQSAGLPEGAVQLVATTDRAAVRELVQLTEFVDVAVPRGGEGLIRAVTEMARVPVIKHYQGICHTYVDVSADLPQALAICENAKCHRPGVCNAMETLLVHQAIAPDFLPELHRELSARGVELRGDTASLAIVPQMRPASEDDWDTEYLDLVLAVRVVSSIDQALEHIAEHGSKHSDAIVAEDPVAQTRFVEEVDSAAVFVNASTRFHDGGQFGMGAELGISTDKLHARGPMGLQELTTYKYVVRGSGQIRD